MKITSLKTNHINNPLGFDLGTPRLSFIAEETSGKKYDAAQIIISLDEDFNKIIFDSGKSDKIDPHAYTPTIDLKPRTRYFWKASVWADNGDFATSEASWFETAKMDESWTAKWIKPDFDKEILPVMKKSFSVEKKITKARAYIVGLGLYELYINGKKVGNEYLTPNLNSYHLWTQYQTYDVTNYINEQNDLSVILGKGWYKGRYWINEGNKYGDEFILLAEIVIDYDDGSSQTIITDESWKSEKSKITDGNIYDGESYDATLNEKIVYNVLIHDKDYSVLRARLSNPCTVKEKIKPIEYIRTPAGEDVLDMGQNMVGLFEFKISAPAGTFIKLQFAELLVNGNFYTENLNSAKQEYNYICDGKTHTVRQHFTFYGFRYVKLTGWVGDIELSDFTGLVVYSDLEETGKIETGYPMVNRLFLNALWGQRGNFVDTPTDCPQRAERMGWTGDAQVFAPTATFNMDTYSFYNKYLVDLANDQKEYNGVVPHVVPNITIHGSDKLEGAACGWADAATIIPWVMYKFYGDKAILAQQLESMMTWVDYMKGEDDKSGGKRLWTTGNHYGDWLALDVTDLNECVGATEIHYLASAYYCHSAELVSKAAAVLGKTEIASEYKKLSDEVRIAIQEEYFTVTGRLAIPTQTAHIIALHMNLVPAKHKERTVTDLRKLFEKNRNKLTTGFLGTTCLLQTLSDNGLEDLAYTLLLNKEYPGWLYEISLGATTIWERWNSLNPDGTMSSTGMNSLNHYAYGSVVEWMYSYMAGIKPLESDPGFRKIRLEPIPNAALKYANTSYRSISGLYRSNWKYIGDNKVAYLFEIPFGCEAILKFPDENEEILLTAGIYEFER